MTFLTVLLFILAILSGLLMIVVILLQSTKSGGGLGAISGGVTEAMFGTAASSVLLKVTVWLAVIFMGSTLLLATVTGRVRGSRSVAETLAPAAEEPPAAATVPDAAGNDVTTGQDTAAQAVDAAADGAAKAVDAAADGAAKASDAAAVDTAKAVDAAKEKDK